MAVVVKEVFTQSAKYEELFSTATALGQAKYISAAFKYALESVLRGAFEEQKCLGFIRFLIQVLGAGEGRPPMIVDGMRLLEGYVEVFGVLPEYKRRGFGQQLQIAAIYHCEQRNCYQMRSRSPITSSENYLLKLKMGYAIQPSLEDDSYYFIEQLSS